MAFWLELAQGVILPLKKKEFRYFFLAQSLSLLGRWVQTTAQRWLLYDLTDSTTYLGLLGALGSFPILLFSLPAGVLTDHLSKKKILVLAQLIGAFMAMLLALLTFAGLVRPWHILALAFGLGIAVSLEFPVRNAFIYEIVGKQDLISALSLHSLAFNLSRFLGPALAGWLMGSLGFGFCFLFNALSYLPVAGIIPFIELKENQKQKSGNLLLSLKKGLIYALRHTRIREILLLIVGVSVGLFPYAILLPALVREAYHGGGREFTFLMSANGLGALAGALFAGTLGRYISHRKLIYLAASSLTLLILALSFSRNLYLAAGLLLAAGFFMVNIITNANAYVQSLCEDEMRGRVLGLFSWCFLGLFPLGSLFWGFLAQRLGTPVTLRISTILAGLVIFILGLRGLKNA